MKWEFKRWIWKDMQLLYTAKMIWFSTLRESNIEIRLCQNPSGQFTHPFPLAVVSLCWIVSSLYSCIPRTEVSCLRLNLSNTYFWYSCWTVLGGPIFTGTSFREGFVKFIKFSKVTIQKIRKMLVREKEFFSNNSDNLDEILSNSNLPLYHKWNDDAWMLG